MRVNSDDFDAFLDEFTSNTYILVIVRDPEVRTSLASFNLGALLWELAHFRAL